MAHLRLLTVPFAAALVAGVLALPASAAPVRPVSDHTITTAHFIVHYYTDVASGVPGPDYSTETQAGDIAADAEIAYATESGWGYPVPLDDGDGKIDIYLDDNTGPPMSGDLGLAIPDNAGPTPSSGMILLATPDELEMAATQEELTLQQEEMKTVAHELFHLFQFATWVPVNQGDDWILESTAQWAGLTLIGAPAGSLVSDIGPPDVALNCRDDIDANHQMCDPDMYIEGGYSRWAFIQMLADKYGMSFVHNVLVNGAAGQSATTALANAIAAKGDSLAGDFNDYAARLMDGNFGVPGLAAVRPTPFAEVAVGIAAITTPATAAVVPLNHLSARYVTFERGDGDASHACYAAKLTVNVAMPSGTSSQPYYYWDVPGSSPQAFSVNGNTASITVPWDTCDWGATRGWVSLPNASTSVDGANFTVTYSVSVDTSTPASATTAPTQASVWGTSVPVPTNDVAPAITVYGPELLQVSSSDPSIRLIVESDGAGTLNAALGAAALGQRTLRAGNNDLRFVVPKNLLNSLRRSAAAANLLTLTPVSPTGAVTGQAVTRHVVITAVKNAKKPVTKKKKPAAKKTPKK